MGDVTTVEIDEPDAVEDYLLQIYGSLRVGAGGGRLGLTSQDAQLGRLRLQRMQFVGDVTVDVSVDQLGAHAIVGVTGGSIEQSNGGPCAPGDVFVPAQPEEPYSAKWSCYAATVALIDPDDITMVVGLSASGAPVRFTSYRATSRDAGRRWIALNHFVWSEILGHPSASSPLVAAHTERLLIATALATFPNDAITDPTRVDRHDAAPPTLRRAVAFIEQNVDQPITMADIAAASGVTVRAVQIAFRRHLDTTPMSYLRRVRLAHAHADLVASDPTRHTVTDIAYRWGFGSPSQFAAYHRAEYGRPPNQTLRGTGRRSDER